MKKLLILGLMASVGFASASTLWDQSQLINMAGGGTGTIAGQHLSMLETGETSYGAGCQSTGPNVLADDFTLTGGATITGFSVFMYTTGATAPNVTGVNFAIGAAPTTTLNAAASLNNAFWKVGGLDVYRVSAGDTASANGIRHIQVVNVTGLNISLGAGTYFLSWNATPGTFSPALPTSLATNGQNMQQSAAGAAFATFSTGATGGDMAFVITGEPVPEPMSILAIGAGLAVLARRRRNRA